MRGGGEGTEARAGGGGSTHVVHGRSRMRCDGGEGALATVSLTPYRVPCWLRFAPVCVLFFFVFSRQTFKAFFSWF